MTYYQDLSTYTYSNQQCENTRNIGWLTHGHDFQIGAPAQVFLEKLWEYCKVSVMQTRGIHSCELCDDSEAFVADWNGTRLILGSSEIRVFDHEGTIFAAPTLIFHYVLRHQYQPPTSFREAVTTSLGPPDKTYFERLTSLNIEWSLTSKPVPGLIRRAKGT